LSVIWNRLSYEKYGSLDIFFSCLVGIFSPKIFYVTRS
jgi:hypothetical protein